MTMSFNSIQNIILIFPDERPVFLREVNNNMYDVTAYFFAKVISELPASLLTPAIFGSIVYFAIGLSTVFWWKFWLFCKHIKFYIFNIFTIINYSNNSFYSINIDHSLYGCWKLCINYKLFIFR